MLMLMLMLLMMLLCLCGKAYVCMLGCHLRHGAFAVPAADADAAAKLWGSEAVQRCLDPRPPQPLRL